MRANYGNNEIKYNSFRFCGLFVWCFFLFRCVCDERIVWNSVNNLIRENIGYLSAHLYDKKRNKVILLIVSYIVMIQHTIPTSIWYERWNEWMLYTVQYTHIYIYSCCLCVVAKRFYCFLCYVKNVERTK